MCVKELIFTAVVVVVMVDHIPNRLANHLGEGDDPSDPDTYQKKILVFSIYLHDKDDEPSDEAWVTNWIALPENVLRPQEYAIRASRQKPEVMTIACVCEVRSLTTLGMAKKSTPFLWDKSGIPKITGVSVLKEDSIRLFKKKKPKSKTMEEKKE